MRVLFSSVPVHGHILPLLPLARALRDRGDDVAFLTAAGAAAVLEPEGIPVVPAGPSAPELFGGAGTADQDPHPSVSVEAVAELFARVRVDLTFKDGGLDAAREWKPDLVVSEMYDGVGPVVGAALGIPTASIGIGPAIPQVLATEFDKRLAQRHTAWGVDSQPARWYLDTCPPSLQRKDWKRPEGWTALRPEAYTSGGQETGAVGASGSRPRVLLSFGTLFSAPQILDPLIEQFLTQDVDLRVTLGLSAQVSDFAPREESVEFAAFTPLAQLLSGVDAVVTHGGAGTVLGALAVGLPLVVVPQGADQPLQAQQVADCGAGISFGLGEAKPQDVAQALARVLAEPSYRCAAKKIAEEINAIPSAAEVAALLADAVTRAVR